MATKYTQSDLDNISAAIVSGLTQAMIQGEMVQYRSLGEMLRIQKLIEADLTPANAATAFAVRYPSTGRGL